MLNQASVRAAIAAFIENYNKGCWMEAAGIYDLKAKIIDDNGEIVGNANIHSSFIEVEDPGQIHDWKIRHFQMLEGNALAVAVVTFDITLRNSIRTGTSTLFFRMNSTNDGISVHLDITRTSPKEED